MWVFLEILSYSHSGNKGTTHRCLSSVAHIYHLYQRLRKGDDDRTEADLKEVKEFMHLIKAPHG